MDRSEFHRIAHTSEREALERCGSRRGETVNVRVGTFVAGPGVFASPRVAFVAGCGRPSEAERMYMSQQRGQSSLPERQPIVMQALNLPPTPRPEVWNSVQVSPQDAAMPRQQRTLVNFANVFRGEDQHTRDILGMRLERNAVADANPDRRMYPVACYMHQRPPCSAPCVGVIAPSIVGRRVMQFRGKSSAMPPAGPDTIAARKHQTPQIVDLVEEDDESSESGSRGAPSRQPDLRDAAGEKQDRNGWKSVEASRALRGKTSQVPGVCFSSNGMMQMDMRLVADELTRGPVSVETGAYEDGFSAADLDSLGIAQQIGQSGPGLFVQRQQTPLQPQRQSRVGLSEFAEVNLVSDEDEHAHEPQLQQPQMTTTVESRQTKASEVGHTQSETHPGGGRRLMDRIQPLLNAIEILSMQPEPVDGDDQMDQDQSGQDDITTTGNSEGGKSVRSRQRKPTPAVRSLNDMSHEMIKNAAQRKRHGKPFLPQQTDCRNEADADVSSADEERTSEETSPSFSFKLKRTKLNHQHQSEKEDSDPYRRVYTYRRRGRRLEEEESRRMVNVPMEEDSAEIRALWKFLNQGILPSQALVEAAPHPLPPPEEADQDATLSHIAAVLNNHKTLSHPRSSADSHASTKVKSWIDSMSAGQLQKAVHQFSLCGLAQALSSGHPTHSI